MLTDVRGTSKQDYSSGQFLAFQAVNDPAADRHQTVTVFPATFPQKTLLKWNWPDDADDRVKSWNGIDYGNYLNTITPVAVVSSKINAISSLLHEVDISKNEAPSDSANVTLDFFLYSSDSSTEATMLS